MIATILSFVLGAVLGLRFKVFVLLPAILSGLVVCVGVGIARAADFWPMVLTMIIDSAAFQLGYLSANALLFFIGAGRSLLARSDGAVHRGEPAGQHAANAVAGQREPVGVVDKPVQDGVGDRRVGDNLVPV